VTHAILDTKGLGRQKDRIMNILNKTSLELYKV
jgi:hypothetical protein